MSLLKKATQTLLRIKDRKGMYFQPVNVEMAETFLQGFRSALHAVGIPVDQSSGRAAFEQRGWKVDTIGVTPSMRAKGLTDMQIMDEHFDAFIEELHLIPDSSDTTTNA
ncbi:MAG: hypothetical protein V4710_15430 [Verrucomicrobiota bacterium]